MVGKKGWARRFDLAKRLILAFAWRIKARQPTAQHPSFHKTTRVLRAEIFSSDDWLKGTHLALTSSAVGIAGCRIS